jgi:hypothetical protein
MWGIYTCEGVCLHVRVEKLDQSTFHPCRIDGEYEFACLWGALALLAGWFTFWKMIVDGKDVSSCAWIVLADDIFHRAGNASDWISVARLSP